MPRIVAPPLPPEGMPPPRPGWFAVRLRHWRLERSLTQEALGFAAEISTRHLSFLESGRARPSEEMIYRLCSVLEVPLDERNRLLVAEGHEPRFPDGQDVSIPAESALRLMMESHEPHPMAVLSTSSLVLRANHGAWALFRRHSLHPDLLDTPFDMVGLVLDPRHAKVFLPDWECVASRILHRLHRSLMEKPRDPTRRAIFERALGYEGVESLWESRSDAPPSDPSIHLRLRGPSGELVFKTLVTTLSEPLEPAFQNLYVETYYPCDDATRKACRNWEVDSTQAGSSDFGIPHREHDSSTPNIPLVRAGHFTDPG